MISNEANNPNKEPNMFTWTSKSENHEVIHTADLTDNTIDGEECGKPDFVLKYVLLNPENVNIIDVSGDIEND